MQTGRRAGPPPPAPRGDGPAPKESLRRARARARPQSTVLARRPSVLVGASSRISAGGLGLGRAPGRRGSVLASRGQPRSGGGPAGLTSKIGADGRFPPAAEAGRRGIPSKSINWSCNVTIARAAAIRSSAGAAGFSTSSPIVSAERLSLRTIWPGKVARAIPTTA
jgi:hypothetical protein